MKGRYVVVAGGEDQELGIVFEQCPEGAFEVHEDEWNFLLDKPIQNKGDAVRLAAAAGTIQSGVP